MFELDVDARRLFDVHTVTRDELVKLIRLWGGDNGGTYVKGLVLQIAELRGFAPITQVDVYPERQLGYVFKKHSDEEHAVAQVVECQALGFSAEHITGANSTGVQHFTLAWAGVKPDRDLILKKLKERGLKP